MPIGAKWYSFKDEVVELLPEKPGVYELGYRGTVVYIGSSESSLRSRLLSHRKRKTFSKVTNFRFRRTTSDNARIVEAKLCKEFVKKNGSLPRLQKVAPKNTKSYIERLLYG